MQQEDEAIISTSNTTVAPSGFVPKQNQNHSNNAAAATHTKGRERALVKTSLVAGASMGNIINSSLEDLESSFGRNQQPFN